MEFDQINEKLIERSPHRGNFQVTKEYHLYPLLPEEIRKHIISSTSSYVPTETLVYLKEEGVSIFIRLSHGSVKTSYGENRSKSNFHKLLGVYEGIFNGKKEWGIMIGGQVSGELKDPPEKEEILKINDYLKILNHMGFLEEKV